MFSCSIVEECSIQNISLSHLSLTSGIVMALHVFGCVELLAAVLGSTGFRYPVLIKR